MSTVIGATPEGFLCESLDRSKYRASEMPQGFRYDIIDKAYRSVILPHHFNISDNHMFHAGHS